MKRIKYICSIFAFCMALTACVHYDAEPFTGKTLPRKSGYFTGITNDWIYFNLRTGQVFNADKPGQDIKDGTQIDRLDWDVAFCGYRLRTNSGTSGKGKGGAIDLGYGKYEKWTSKAQLPENPDWVVDDSTVYVTMSQNDWAHYLVVNGLDPAENPWFDPNSGPATAKTSANPLLANAMSFAGPPPVYTPSVHTYVIRTADGARYFKFQLISWYDANVQIGDEGGKMSFYIDELK